ncbi:MAG TPA: hypothetical protein VFE90_09800, partial [Myxococcales bacterium]|nr:hypothetical protein [Myxococcales bacterium]
VGLHADVVVATSRNLAVSTPDKLRPLVDRAIAAIVAEGQLDECEITLRDLELTAGSFARSLESISARAEVTPPGAPRLRVLESEQLKRA